MKDQPWHLNQTWPVGRKWCRFTNAPQKFRGPSPKIWGTNKFWTTYSATSALDTAYLGNETSHEQTKMLMSIYNVSPTRWPNFRDIWPRNGCNPFAYCDATFGGHYVAAIKVATSLVGTWCLDAFGPCWTCAVVDSLEASHDSGSRPWIQVRTNWCRYSI